MSMAWVAVSEWGLEYIFDHRPHRKDGWWWLEYACDSEICVPRGTIKKLIGRELTWEDEPVELK